MIGPPVVIGIATTYGWREAFYVVHSRLPDRVLHLALGARSAVRHARAGEPGGAPAASGAAINRWALLKERNILLCVLISGFFLTWFVVIISFAPVFSWKAAICRRPTWAS